MPEENQLLPEVQAAQEAAIAVSEGNNPNVSNFGLGDITQSLTTDTSLPATDTFSNTNPQLDMVITSVRQKTPRLDLPDSKFASAGMDSIFGSFLGDIGQSKKLNPVDYNVDLNEIYTPLSDGTYIPKFDNYISGTNNEERLALEQGIGEKWVNGISKNLFSKTALNVLDGTIGTVYGLANGIAEGSMSAIYDNEFSNFIDDLNTKLDNSLPNYYTEQEKSKGFFGSMGTANFWTNDFAGGLSFMFGTIISESIWAAATGGASLATLGARGVLKAGAKSLPKGVLHSPTKLLNKYLRTIPASNVGKGLNNARFLYTSAGYEAGVESRHYMNEQKESFIQSYQRNFGRRPSPKELAAFNNDLTNSANTLFASNVALVGSSNIAQFGAYFGLQAGLSKRVNKYLGKKIGLGITSTVEKGKDVYNALDATGIQKAAGRVFFTAKAPFVEGFVEEGGQAVLSGTGERWLSSKYNPEALKENYGLMEAAYESFSHTYGSKEGFKEIGLGMLIGLFGQAGRGFNLREYDNKAQQNITQAENLNSYSNENLINKLSAITQQKSAFFDAMQAQEKGEVLQASLDLKRGFFSKMSAEYDAGLLDDSHDNFRRVLESTPDETISEQFGVNIEDAQEIREEILDDYSSTVDDFKKSIRVAESILPDNISDMNIVVDGENQTIANSDIRSILALNLFMGKNSDRLASQYAKEISELVGDEGVYSALEQKRLLERVGTDTLKEYNKIIEEISDITRILEVDQNTFVQASIRKQNSTNKSESELKRLAEREEELAIKREKLTKRQDQLNSELGVISKKLNRASRAFNIVNQEFNIPFIGDRVSPDALLTFSETLTELEETLDVWRESDPQAYDRISYLLDQYRKAEFSFVNVNEAFNKLSDPRFRSKAVTSIFGKVFSKSKLDKVGANDPKSFTANTYAFLVDSFYTDQALFSNAPSRAQDQAQDQAQDPNEQEPDGFPIPSSSTNVNLDLDVTVENPLIDAITRRINTIVSQRRTLEDFDTENFTRDDVVTQNDIDEYKNLLRKKRRNDNGLRPKDVDRFRELKLKLNNYGRLQGTIDSGSKLSDLLQQLVSLQELTVKELSTKVDSNNKEALSSIVDSEFEGFKSRKNADNTQTYDKAFVKKEFNGNFTISNINIQGLLELIASTQELEIRRGRSKGTIESPAAIKNVKPGNKFTIRFVNVEGEPAVTFKIGTGNNISFSGKDRKVLEANTILNTLPTSNLPTSYQTLLRDIKEDDGSTTVIPVPTNFTLEPGVTMDTDALAALEENQEVHLEVSTRNEYNKQLFANVDTNAELTKKQRQEIQDGMVIYVKAGKKVVSVLKSGTKLSSINDKNLQALNEIRIFALQRVIEERFAENQTIDLETTIPVNFAYLGHPNFTMSKENGTVSVQNRGFDQSTLDKVEDIGYIQDGVLTLNRDTKGINTIYVSSYSKKNKDKQIPIIIFKYKGKKIAYPVSLQEVSQDRASRMDEILGTTMSVVDKVESLNSILADARLDVGKIGFYYNNNEDTNLTNSDHIAAVKSVLSEVKDYSEIEDWTTLSFKDAKTALAQQALININLNDNPFHSPKLKLRISEFSTPADVNLQSITEVEELSDDLMEEAKIIQNKEC